MWRRIAQFFLTGPDQPSCSADPEEVRRRYRRLRWRVLLSITLGYGLYYVTRLSLQVVKAPLIEAGLFSPTELGVISAGLLWVYAVGRFLNGVLADRCNMRRFMSAGLLGTAIVNLALGFSSGFMVFLLLWGLNGWLQSMGAAPSVVSISQWFGRRERGSAYSLWSLAHNLGEALSFAGIGLVAAAWGWRAGLWVPGLVCLLGGLVLLRTHADRPQTLGLPPIWRHVADPPPDPASHERSLGALQLEVLKNPWIWVLGLSAFLLYVSRYGINHWAMTYLQLQKGYSLEASGALAAAGPLLGILGTLGAGVLSDRLFGSRRHPLLLGYGLIQIGALVLLRLVPPGEPWLDSLALGLFGFATGGLLVYQGGLLAVDIVPRRATGAAMGFIGLCSYLGAGVQDVATGLLVEAPAAAGAPGQGAYDFHAAFAVWTGASVLSLVLALATWRVRPRE
ncbi:MAG TPA: MFS transporter [Myxococcota bacterium]|nr:MFS transporter [Myxococcota bacterium]HRY93354.1 MFS transporter [Myxococcota bacterium]HSA20151.1 MFS transporter [Myxococcota bacterium]